MIRASFHPLAERELIDAIQYYELESPVWVRRFSTQPSAANVQSSSIPTLEQLFMVRFVDVFCRPFPMLFCTRLGQKAFGFLW